MTQDADENILEVCHFQGDAKKYELRPSMRLEALLLALAGQSIRAEVVDYGECFFPGPAFLLYSWGERKSVWPQRKLVFQTSQRIAGKAVTAKSTILRSLQNLSFLAAKSVSTFL